MADATVAWFEEVTGEQCLDPPVRLTRGNGEALGLALKIKDCLREGESVHVWRQEEVDFADLGRES